MRSDDASILAALQRLDPAPGSADGAPATLTPEQGHRAAATLDRILAAGPAPTPDERAPLRDRRRHPRRLTLAALAALVVAVAVVVPVLTSGGSRAYATWTPLPVALSPAESVTAAQACLESQVQGGRDPVAPLLAERRGAWTYVLLRPSDELELSCLMPTAEITGTSVADRGRWFGSSNAERTAPASRPDQVRVDTATTGSTQEGLFSYSEGVVGRDVAAVTFTTPRGVTVQASVAQGRFAVWWPAGRNDLRSREIGESAEVDVTLIDGTRYRLTR